MGTGYTYDVSTGKITDFPTFVLRCARAFGALVHMRDDSLDAEVPSKILPSPFYKKRLAEMEALLLNLEQMSPTQIQEETDKYNQAGLDSWQKGKANQEISKAHYQTMLAKVDQWTPPSEEHFKLKAFMQEQLQESIKWDCGGYQTPPSLLTSWGWHVLQTKLAKDGISRYKELYQEEEERAASRTLWLRQLKASLKE